MVSAGVLKRIAAFALDYLQILAYLSVLLGVGLGIRRLVGVDFSSPLAADAVAFMTTVLPITVYFASRESSSAQATWGKRRLGLKLVDGENQRSSFGRTLARELLKFLPWQVAHSSLVRIPGWPSEPQDPTWGVWAGLIASQALALVYVVSLAIGSSRRTLYDRLCGTRVVVAR